MSTVCNQANIIFNIIVFIYYCKAHQLLISLVPSNYFSLILPFSLTHNKKEKRKIKQNIGLTFIKKQKKLEKKEQEKNKLIIKIDQNIQP